MNVTSALYYPHTRIRSMSLLKSALLLWDYVECIMPLRQLSPTKGETRGAAEAMDLVVRKRVPTKDERRVVHDRLAEMLHDGVPRWLQPDVQPSNLRRPFLMYPEKLAGETWRMLKHADLAEFDKRSGDFVVPPALGLFALSLLADECAGKTRTKITDRDRAYAWLCGVMTERLGGEYLPALQASQLAASYDRLITASVRVINTDGIPLGRLIALRKKEQAGQAPELRPLRAKYLATLDEHVKLLLQPNLKKSDALEIERQFERDRGADFRELKRELGFAAKEAIFSKEIGVCALAVAGAVATPVLAPVAAAVVAPATLSLKGVGVGALLLTKAKYRRAREKALNANTMSWLYVASKRRWL